MSIFDFSLYALGKLSSVSNKEWGATFVALRMSFNQRYPHKTFSTSHGTNFFDNIIESLSKNERWREGGEYGQNFRELVDKEIANIKGNI